MIYKIDNWEQQIAFEKWAEENNISLNDLYYLSYFAYSSHSFSLSYYFTILFKII